MTEELTPRRREILAAATTVLARQGSRGLTHRAVDREAGLPEGSSSAYFRTRDALLQALGDFVSDRMAGDVSSLARRLGSRQGDHEYAVAEVSRLFLRWLDRPELLTARLEIAVAATRDAALASRSGEWRAGLIAVVDDILRRAGKSDAGQSAQTLLAALDGVLLASLLQPPRHRRAFVRDSVEELLALLQVADETARAAD